MSHDSVDRHDRGTSMQRYETVVVINLDSEPPLKPGLSHHFPIVHVLDIASIFAVASDHQQEKSCSIHGGIPYKRLPSEVNHIP